MITSEVARKRQLAYWAKLSPKERKVERERRMRGKRGPGFPKGHGSFRTKESYIKAGKKLSISLTGRKLSEETKRKISRAKKGRPLSKETKRRMLGRTPWNKGGTLTEDHKQKLRVARRELRERQGYLLSPERRKWISENQRGENHPNWLGGKSPYGLKFNDALKESIRKRDGHTCRVCDNGGSDRKLDVHHIDYNKFNNDEKNLVSLCRACHTKTNFNRDSWRAYFAVRLTPHLGHSQRGVSGRKK